MKLQEITPFIFALLASGGGAFILVLLENWLVATPGDQARLQRRLLYWGAAALLLVPLQLLAAIWEHLAPGSGAAQLTFLSVLIAVTPLQVGILVFLLVNWRAITGMGRRSLLILLPLAVLLIGLAIFIPGLILLLAALAILVALLWQIKAWAVDLLSIAVLLVLVFQKTFQPDLSLSEAITVPGSSSPLVVAANFALVVLMLLLYILPALLVYHGLKTTENQTWIKRSLRLALVAALLLLIAYDVGENAFWASAQSRVVEDNFPIQSVLPILLGLLLALFLPGWRRLAGALYGLLVPALLITAFVLGWNISNTKVTEARARRIENALSNYYQQNERYPDRLAQLTPGYLLFNLPPAGNDLDRSWCYQSGPHAYRLGYVVVDFIVPYRMPEVSVKILQQAGSLPNVVWDCDSKAQAVKAIYTARYH
jgi:hypothetical protein